MLVIKCQLHNVTFLIVEKITHLRNIILELTSVCRKRHVSLCTWKRILLRILNRFISIKRSFRSSSGVHALFASSLWHYLQIELLHHAETEIHKCLSGIEKNTVTNNLCQFYTPFVTASRDHFGDTIHLDCCDSEVNICDEVAFRTTVCISRKTFTKRPIYFQLNK